MDHNERAIAALFDDVVLTHVPFPVVFQNGHLEQLNQNGQAEDMLVNAIAAINRSAYGQVFVPANFRR